MLKIQPEQFQKIVAQGLEGKPLEICGFLAGQRICNGAGEIVKEVLEVFPIESDDKSELTYTMNPLQQMRAEKEIRSRELEIVGIYHTHPATEPFPSKTDVARAHWGDSDDLLFPEYSYLIVSLRTPSEPEPRSFRIQGRNLPDDIEEEFVIID